MHEARINYQSLNFNPTSQATRTKRDQKQNLKLSNRIWVRMAWSTHLRPSRAMEIMDLFQIQSTYPKSTMKVSPDVAKMER